MVDREYDANVDSKNRVTIRGAKSKYYHVKVFKDGRMELEPRYLAKHEELSDEVRRNLREEE